MACLTGLGLEDFDKYAAAFLQIYQVLSNSLPAGALSPWKPANIRGHTAIEFFNRYFSGTEEADDRPAVDFDKAVDPFGILSSAEVTGIHTEDNEVEYFERQRKEGYVEYQQIRRYN